jgi:hypothetical protein
MKTKDRIKTFLSEKKIGRNKIEKELDLGIGYFSSKGNSISSDVIEKIADRFPELNIDWLLTGKGNMLKTQSESGVSQSIVGNNNSSIGNINNSGFFAGNIKGNNIDISNGRKPNINKDVIHLENRIKELENEVKELKNDKSILQEFVAFLQNKNK